MTQSTQDLTVRPVLAWTLALQSQGSSVPAHMKSNMSWKTSGWVTGRAGVTTSLCFTDLSTWCVSTADFKSHV